MPGNKGTKGTNRSGQSPAQAIKSAKPAATPRSPTVRKARRRTLQQVRKKTYNTQHACSKRTASKFPRAQNIVLPYKSASATKKTNLKNMQQLLEEITELAHQLTHKIEQFQEAVDESKI